MMNKLFLALLLIVLFPLDALAALNAGTMWENRTLGSDTNGCGFSTGVGTKSTKTDLVIDGTTSTKVTSAGYVFSSADVNRWLNITAGTGFNLGYYHILSVSGSTATLDASAGTLGSTAGSFGVWWGQDYTQQNAANANGGSNGSSVLAVTAGTTTVTCADCSFTNDIIGNAVYLSGGTGSVTPQRYGVTAYTNATTITVDRSTGLTAGTDVTINIGGACASLTETLSARGAIAANKIFVKADGTYSSSGITTTLNPINIIGYTSTRGDGGQATVQIDGTTSVYVIANTVGSGRVSNIIFDCNNVSGCGGFNEASYNMAFVTAKRYDGIGVNMGANSNCYKCEATAGTVNATAGLKITTSSACIVDGYVHDGNGPGIVSAGTCAVTGSVVANQAGAAADGIQITGTGTPTINNTVYNSGRDGIFYSNSGGLNLTSFGNVLVNNGRYGLNTAFTSAQPSFPNYDGNAYYGNTSGATNNISDTISRANIYHYVNRYDKTLTGQPFISTSTPNWGLNNTSGAGLSCQGTGQPQTLTGATSTIPYPDMGAVPHNVNSTPNFAY